MEYEHRKGLSGVLSRAQIIRHTQTILTSDVAWIKTDAFGFLMKRKMASYSTTCLVYSS